MLYNFISVLLYNNHMRVIKKKLIRDPKILCNVSKYSSSSFARENYFLNNENIFLTDRAI